MAEPTAPGAPDQPQIPGAGPAGGHRADAGRPFADPDTLSVWATAQATGPVQRRGRYLPESVRHPARMLPAIAAHAIGAYTRAGELVLDPMCGIGTTLVEAVHAGRDAIDVEYESRWSDLADANLAHAYRQGATGRGSVVRGDATTLHLPRTSSTQVRRHAGTRGECRRGGRVFVS